jgi:hypothetical protein
VAAGIRLTWVEFVRTPLLLQLALALPLLFLILLLLMLLLLPVWLEMRMCLRPTLRMLGEGRR